MKHLSRHLPGAALLAASLSVLVGVPAHAGIEVLRSRVVAPAASATEPTTSPANEAAPTAAVAQQPTVTSISSVKTVSTVTIVTSKPTAELAPPPAPSLAAQASAPMEQPARTTVVVIQPMPEPAPVPVVVVAEPFEIQKGIRIDKQLAEYGRSQGWDMIWEAPEYVFDKTKTIPGGDFENAMVYFLNGVNETGEHLRATFYRGNKTVRVTEF